MPTPVLATKLYLPPLRADLVVRTRLLARLNAGRHHKLALISAPAGFGKTTLISEWVGGCELLDPPARAAWLSLDEGDSDLARFLTYLVAATQSIIPGLGDGILAALQLPQPPQTEPILIALLNEISACPDHIFLVLDDYHTIDSKAVDQALVFLVEHLPPQMHLVIASREDPPLPLALLRARDQLTELRAADLRFTLAEAVDFLNRIMGLSLSVEDIAALEARTEGWIAGLQMAALALQGQLSWQGVPDAASFIRAFTGSHRFVLDYLLAEVLEKQSEGVQNFLLRTSILDRLCGPLCEAVVNAAAGSGQATIEYLEAANLFIVPLDNERCWYRYHHLFRDLLRKWLEQSLAPGEIAALHTRASVWCESSGLVFAAFRHATLAGDNERAERLLERKDMPLHLHSVAMAALDWLVSLPAAALDARPGLWIKSATLALMAGQTSGVEERLLAAESALQNTKLDRTTRDWIGKIACARATLALTRYQPEVMIAQARRALEYLPADDLIFRFTANWALATASFLLGDRVTAAQASKDGIAISQISGDLFSMILATAHLAEAYELDNQLHRAAETYQKVLSLAGEHPHPNVGEVHLGLARISYEWNDLDAAERHGQRSLILTRQYDRAIDRSIISEVFLSRLKLARGDVDGAAEQLNQAEHAARQKGFLLRMPEIAAQQVLVFLRQGRLAAADRLARRYDLPLSQARVLLAQGDQPAALALLAPRRRQLEIKGWPDERLKVMVLQAVALGVQGDQDGAGQVLAEALALAEPGGFVRTFVDEGAPLARLLHEALLLGYGSPYAHRLLQAFPQPALEKRAAAKPRTAGSEWVEPLGEREIEVLQLIADGLTNQEIADRLHLSMSTVKVHTRNIYSKLDAHHRAEAVARARTVGILSG